MKRLYIVGFGTVLLSLYLRIYQLSEIPGEWFGDISNVHEYVTQILQGKWPFYFMQSPGPLYHYLIIPLVVLFRNQGYLTYKIASVVVSFSGLWGTYLFVKVITGKKLALITTVVMSFSFWYLVWSRLGNSQIVIPVLIVWQSYLTALYISTRKKCYIIWGAIVASLGWYTYPQTFIFPIIYLIVFIVLFFRSKKLKMNGKTIFGLTLLLIIMAIPFGLIVRNQARDNFGTNGYVGQKIVPVFSMPIQEIIGKFAINYGKYLLEYHVRGDVIFRSNVPYAPHLDRISGILMLVGVVYFYQKKRRGWILYILFLLAVLPIPSLSPAILEGEVPSSARTLAVTPFVYVLIGAGLMEIYQLLDKLRIQYKYIGLIGLLIIGYFMAYTNLQEYFASYVRGLPDQNLAPGKIIAKYIDRYPANYALYFASCCWGQWGEPEPKGVVYVLRKKRIYASLNSDETKGCGDIKIKPAIVVIGPTDEQLVSQFSTCRSYYSRKFIKKGNTIIGQALIFHDQTY